MVQRHAELTGLKVVLGMTSSLGIFADIAVDIA
jgi:hypothetical protein